ncbi:hypothetical protein FOMPIDRAFT_1054083 [Fomitopsis schrenkii]|uniref:Uncharacterized protein n=1 Tax=Fomitopsis schrenkii TaxID=2126942 RepID=S8FAC5_FOMSC|nr:hypothetical protein FOMPIDRAFT_1054083 [Fomitopsis schrenkii]
MLTPSRTGLFPSSTQKKIQVDYSKAAIGRRRSSHGPSPLGRTVSTPSSPVGSKLLQRPLRTGSSGPNNDKENASATSTSHADTSSSDDGSKQMAKTPPRLATEGRVASNVAIPTARTATSTDNSEEEDTYEDELDGLIAEFREWKSDMKDTMDDFKMQLDELQKDYFRTLRAIPTDIIAD